MIITIDDEGNITIDGEHAYTFENNPGIKIIGEPKHGMTISNFNMYPINGQEKKLHALTNLHPIGRDGAGIYIKQTITVTEKK